MRERYLGRKLGAETLADENGVAEHEIAKTVVNTVDENGFHDCPVFSSDLQRRRRRRRVCSFLFFGGFSSRFSLSSNREARAMLYFEMARHVTGLHLLFVMGLETAERASQQSITQLWQGHFCRFDIIK